MKIEQLFSSVKTNKSPYGDLYTKVRIDLDDRFLLIISSIPDIAQNKMLFVTSFNIMNQSGLINKLFNIHIPYIMGVLSTLNDINQDFMILIDEIYIRNNVDDKEFLLIKEYLVEPKIYSNPSLYCSGNSRDENGYVIDAISYEPINPGEEVQIGNTCYLVETVKTMIDSGYIIDPFTRLPIPQDIINKYKTIIPTNITIDGIEYPIEKDGSLDLSTANITNDNIDQLESFSPYIKSLILNESKVTDLTPIKNFKNLVYLNLEESDVTNIDVISEFPSLKVLNMSSCKNLYDFSPLIHCRSLRVLFLADTNVNDLYFIKNCTFLTTLDISMTKVSDLTKISHLTSLQKLYMENIQITSLDAISTLINLYELYACNNMIDNIEAVTNMLDINELDVAKTDVKDLNPLTEKIHLSLLNLDQTKVESIEVVKGLYSLSSIAISHTDVTDISPLFELELEEVDITGLDIDRDEYNKILEIPSLKKLTIPDGSIIRKNVNVNRGGQIYNTEGEEDLMDLTNDGIHDIDAIRENYLDFSDSEYMEDNYQEPEQDVSIDNLDDPSNMFNHDDDDLY